MMQLFQQLLLISILAWLPVISLAQAVQSEGHGSSRQEAIKDALLTAIEKANGIALFSRTTLEKEQLIEDTITSSGFGYIASYYVVNEKALEEGVKVVLVAEVVDRPSSVSNMAPLTLQFEEPSYHQVDATQENVRRQESLFVKQYEDIHRVVSEGYEFSVKGITVSDVTPDTVNGSISVRAQINSNYWRQYDELIKKLSVPGGNMNSGIFNGERCLSIKKGVSLPQHLVAHDIPAIKVRISVAGFSRNAFLYRNSIILLPENNFPSFSAKPVNSDTPNAQVSLEVGRDSLCQKLPRPKELYRFVGIREITEGYLYTSLLGQSKVAALSGYNIHDLAMVFDIPFAVPSSTDLKGLDPRLSIKITM